MQFPQWYMGNEYSSSSGGAGGDSSWWSLFNFQWDIACYKYLSINSFNTHNNTEGGTLITL